MDRNRKGERGKIIRERERRDKVEREEGRGVRQNREREGRKVKRMCVHSSKIPSLDSENSKWLFIAQSLYISSKHST